MISSKIFFFGLFSASLISVGSAVLDGPHALAIRLFQYNLQHEWPLAVACAHVDPAALKAYFLDRIDHYDAHVDHYNPGFGPERNQVPEPDHSKEFIAIFNELPRFVWILLYSNVNMLNQIKGVLPPPSIPPESTSIPPESTSIPPDSILAMITDQYVGYLANHYPTIRATEGERSFRPYILNVAILFSLNRAMLNVIHNHAQRKTLAPMIVEYQDMITQFYELIRKYMLMKNLLPYHQIFFNLGGIINLLSNGRDTQSRDDSIRPAVANLVTNLVNTILSMIAIMGMPRPLALGATPVSGSVLIFNILRNMWSVRRLMGLEIQWQDAPDGVWYRQLLKDLQYVLLETIGPLSEAWEEWIAVIGPMLGKGQELVTVAFG
jgi:hypothetical protein